MQRIPVTPSRTELVYHALLDEICAGTLMPGTHLVQEQLASRLGVSRQPIQQAMALLKADGLVSESGGRGLYVAPLDVRVMRQRYEIREVLDALAAKKAALNLRDGHVARADIEAAGTAILLDGFAALDRDDIARMVQHDVAFHRFLYGASGNGFIATTAEPHWRYLQRAMGEVLRHAQPGRVIWTQHRAILDAVLSGNPDAAAKAAQAHVSAAAARLAGVFDAMTKGGNRNAE